MEMMTETPFSDHESNLYTGVFVHRGLDLLVLSGAEKAKYVVQVLCIVHLSRFHFSSLPFQ